MATCLEAAQERLSQRPIKPSTMKEYLGTLRALGIEETPLEEATVAFLNGRLQQVLTASTRRKHAINLRAALGVGVRCPRAERRHLELPPVSDLRVALEDSPYRLWGLAMLYGGLRLGEACTKQHLEGNVLFVDRQRLPDGSKASAKTSGPVHIPRWLADQYQDHDFERSPNTVYTGLRRAGRRHGLEVRPHLLRHAFATALVAAGASPEVLRRQMRHASVTVSLTYYVHVTTAELDGVMELLP